MKVYLVSNWSESVDRENIYIEHSEETYIELLNIAIFVIMYISIGWDMCIISCNEKKKPS